MDVILSDKLRDRLVALQSSQSHFSLEIIREFFTHLDLRLVGLIISNFRPLFGPVFRGHYTQRGIIAVPIQTRCCLKKILCRMGNRLKSLIPPALLSKMRMMFLREMLRIFMDCPRLLKIHCHTTCQYSCFTVTCAFS